MVSVSVLVLFDSQDSGVQGFCLFLPILHFAILHFFNFRDMVTKKKQSSNLPPPFLNHWVKLPKNFWGEAWAKNEYRPGYKKMFDVLQLHGFKKGGAGHADSYLFKLGNEEEFHLPRLELVGFDKNGLVSGTSIAVVCWLTVKRSNSPFFAADKPAEGQDEDEAKNSGKNPRKRSRQAISGHLFLPCYTNEYVVDYLVCFRTISLSHVDLPIPLFLHPFFHSMPAFALASALVEHWHTVQTH